MKKKRAGFVCFLLYCALMLWLLFDRSGYEPGVPYAHQLRWNLIPFETVVLFYRLLTSGNPAYRMHAIINLGGNILMFIPLGFFLPLLFPRLRKLGKTLLTTALIITAVEIIQLLTLVGSCDVDDLILNVLGAAIGYGFYKVTNKPAP